MYKSKLSVIFMLGMLVCGPIFAEELYRIQPLDENLNPIEEEITEKEYNFSDVDLDSAIYIALKSNRTIKNHFVPMTLLTFVAPVEPEPTVLMSTPLKSFTTIYPVGIEPIKYPIIRTSNIIVNSPILMIFSHFSLLLIF